LRVVVDAYFSKVPFLSPLIAKGIHVITRMRKDAVAWDKKIDDESKKSFKLDGKVTNLSTSVIVTRYFQSYRRKRLIVMPLGQFPYLEKGYPLLKVVLMSQVSKFNL